MQTGLAGKVVIVTAATANIGRGIALAFAAEGARVVINGRDPVAGELVAKLARARAEDPERLMAIGRKTAPPRNHARPPEIGAAPVYLASEAAAFVTGHTLQVDGGVCLV